MTALMAAACNNEVEIVRRLLELGANVHARHIDGSTALLGAAEEGHSQIVYMLLEAGANIAVRNEEEKTAVKLAIEGGHDQVIDIIHNYITKSTAEIALKGYNSQDRSQFLKQQQEQQSSEEKKLRLVVEELVNYQHTTHELQSELKTLRTRIVETMMEQKRYKQKLQSIQQQIQENNALFKVSYDNINHQNHDLEQENQELQNELTKCKEELEEEMEINLIRQRVIDDHQLSFAELLLQKAKYEEALNDDNKNSSNIFAAMFGF
jgi:ankyrin repeat protein